MSYYFCKAFEANTIIGKWRIWLMKMGLTLISFFLSSTRTFFKNVTVWFHYMSIIERSWINRVAGAIIVFFQFVLLISRIIFAHFYLKNLKHAGWNNFVGYVSTILPSLVTPFETTWCCLCKQGWKNNKNVRWTCQAIYKLTRNFCKYLRKWTLSWRVKKGYFFLKIWEKKPKTREDLRTEYFRFWFS